MPKNLCNMEVNLDVNKIAPVLSQSEMAFSSRYHTGKNTQTGGTQCPCDNCPCDCVCDENGCRCNEDCECNCGCQMNGGGYYLNVAGQRVGGLPEVNAVFDPNPPKFSPKPAGKYPQPLYLSNQKGGAYSYIVNPETGRRVKLNGRIGKKVLRNYLLTQSGGDLSIFDPNMQNRQFGCKQPEWSPNCV